MRWPWQKRERREAQGGYAQLIARLIEAQASGSTQRASATAGVEAAAGLLSRAFASASVEAAEWAREAISPVVLGQVGRDLVRVGECLHVIRMGTGDGPVLVPASTWYWEGRNPDPSTWTCTATAYAPSGSATWRVPREQVIFLAWGSPTARPYHGLSPGAWAATTARLHAEAEGSLADEASGPVGQLIPLPVDGGDGGDDDPLAMLKADITKARGKAVLVETTAAGFGTGMAEAPRRDWVAARLGPDMPPTMVEVAQQAFERVLAAAGVPPSLFTDADGTAQREAVRRWHMNVVLPLARVLEHELSRNLQTPVRLEFDGYPKDMVSRAQVFAKLAAQEGVTVQQALELAGLIEPDE